RVGELADVACFSFYANKTITTGEGGMATTADPALERTIRSLSLHGMSRDAWARFRAGGSWDYAITAAGFKYNMTDVAAALGLRQLARADRFRSQRAAIASRYNAALADLEEVEVPRERADRQHAWHLYPLRLCLDHLATGRDEFIRTLAARGVATSVHWRPLHMQPFYAVRLSGPGPILFRQARVGRGGGPFDILKFRTMRVSQRPGPLLTTAGDPRVTRVGRVLRRWKLDELPQLINVLRGEMSFVGPRPEVPRYVDMFAETYRELLAVRPGITDPASVAFRDEEALLGRSPNAEELYVHEILPRKLELSQAYVRQRSLGLDLRLMARTVAAILGWGATSEQTS